jgi:DNA polymerase-1
MRKVAFDVETHLIQPGMVFPKLVCVSISDGQTHDVFLAGLGLKEMLRHLQDPNTQIIGHNVSFDLGVIAAEAIDQGYDPHWVMELIFNAYAADRIVDTMIRAMLVAIAQGKFQEIEGQRRGKQFGLDVLSDAWLGTTITKKSYSKKQQAQGANLNSWRLHYAALENTPLAQWPKDAYDYALEDAVVTWKINEAISAWAISEGQVGGEIPDEYRQVRAAWVLHLIGGWGVRVDEQLVNLVKTNLEAQRKASYDLMDQYGLFKKAKDGSFKLTKKGSRQKDLKRLRALIEDGYAQQGETPPLTAGGKEGKGKKQTKTDADTARESGNIAAIAYADGASAEKLLNTYVPILERGKNGLPVTSNPNVLVASGRTSWTNPNWQNPPRVGGIRECVVPRPGCVLVGADLDTVELRGLAQSCLEILGYSDMAAALQRGEDLHLALAADILGIDYQTALARYNSGDPVVSEMRQTCKKVNFGLPGGMGAPKFAVTCINDGNPLISDPNAPLSDHIARAKILREAWFRKWTEMRAYLRNAGDITGEYGQSMIEQPWSGRIRGGLDYCSCANTFFQGRVADGAKLALWRVAYACYVDKFSPLYGSRIVLFLHDEIILEVPEHMLDVAAKELVRLMCDAVQEVIPSIPITSTACAMRRWWKGCKPVFIGGVLVPSKPFKDPSGKVKWVHDTGEEDELWLAN